MIDEDEEVAAKDATAVTDAEALLRAEIGFWRDLLSNRDRRVPPDSVERMQQALALAEWRLLQLRRQDGAGTASCAGPTRTSNARTRFLH